MNVAFSSPRVGLHRSRLNAQTWCRTEGQAVSFGFQSKTDNRFASVLIVTR